MGSFEIGIIVLLIFMFVGRWMGANALKELSIEQKIKLLETFTSYRKYVLIPVVVVIGLFLFGLEMFPHQRIMLMVFYFVSLVLVLMFSNFYIFRQLKEVDLPQSYLKRFWISRSLIYSGLGLFLGLTVLDMWKD